MPLHVEQSPLLEQTIFLKNWKVVSLLKILTLYCLNSVMFQHDKILNREQNGSKIVI